MELTRSGAEFEPRPVAPQPVREGPLAALLEWQAMAEGAYSANTLRAQKQTVPSSKRFANREGWAICQQTRRPSARSLRIG
jgi:hypothetical protein